MSRRLLWAAIYIVTASVVLAVTVLVEPPTASAQAICMPTGSQLEALRARATRDTRHADPHHHVRYHAWTRHYKLLLTAWRQACWRNERTLTGTAVASWYSLWGSSTASGHVLSYGDSTMASKSMPLGTICWLSRGRRRAVGVVRDRGPYVDGRDFDLEQSLAQRLGIGGVGTVRYRCIRPAS